MLIRAHEEMAKRVPFEVEEFGPLKGKIVVINTCGGY